MTSKNYLLKALIILNFLILIAVGVASAGTYTVKWVNVTSVNDTLNLNFVSTVSNASLNLDIPFLAWKYVDRFPLTSATTTYAQYCVQVNGNYVNVTNSTGALKASLYDPNFWTYVDPNGSDIRIFNQNGVQMYFWIENFNATTQQATIWVNLSTGSTELDVAYDNPNALPSEYNNGSKTFEFFDDFNTLSQHWITAAGAWAVSSSYLTPTSSASNNWIVNNETNLSNYVIYSRGFAGSSTYTQYGVICNAQGTTSTSAIDLLSIANGYLKIYKGYTGAWTELASVAYTVTAGDEVLTMQYMTGTTLHGTVWDLTAGTSASVSATVSYTAGFAGLFESPFTTAAKFDVIFAASLADPASFSTPYQIVPEANVTVGTFTTTTNATTVAIPSTAFSSVTKVNINSSENLPFNATLKFDYAYSSTSKIIDTGTVIEKNFTINTTRLTVPITLNVTFPLRTESYKLFMNVSPSTTVSNTTTNTSIITSYILQNNTSYNINEKVGYLIAKFIGKDELTSNTLSTLTVNYTSSTGWRSTSGASVSIYGTDLPLHQTVIEFSSISYSNRHYILDATKLNQSVTLYLLADSSSTMITYTVVSGTSTLPNAKVEIYKYIGDKYVLIDSQYTDASGVVAVPLHAFDTYKVVASKPGYNTVTATITVTQATYTIKLGGVNLAIPASHRAVVIFKPSQSTLQPGNNTISIDIIPQGTTITTATMTVYVNNTPVASTSKSDITAPTTLSVPVTLNQSSSVSVKVSYTQDGQTVTTQKNYTVPVATGLWATLLLLNNQLNFPGGKTIGLLIAAFITLAVVASLAATTNTNARGLGLIGMIIFTIIALPLGAISIGILVVVWVAVIAAWILWRYI